MFNNISGVIKDQLTMMSLIPGKINSAVDTISNVAAIMKETARSLEKTYVQLEHAFENNQSPPETTSASSTSSEVIIDAEYAEISDKPEITYQCS